MIEECLVVEFRVTGDDCPLATATRQGGATVHASAPQLRRDGNALLRFSASSTGDLAGLLEADERLRYLHASRDDDRVTFRCFSTHPCVVHDLTDAGFLVDAITYEGGEERYVGAVVGYDVLEGVLAAAGETVGVTLERIYPLGPDDDPAPVGERAPTRQWDLTPAQREALALAHEMGYFSVPRETTASEVAAALGIGKSAFLERLRRGQQSVFGGMFR